MVKRVGFRRRQGYGGTSWVRGKLFSSKKVFPAPQFHYPLFIPQRFDRVEFGGFPGWVEAEEDADGGGDQDGGDDCAGAAFDGPMGEFFDHEREGMAEDDSDDTAGEAEDNGFDEELFEYIA